MAFHLLARWKPGCYTMPLWQTSLQVIRELGCRALLNLLKYQFLQPIVCAFDHTSICTVAV